MSYTMDWLVEGHVIFIKMGRELSPDEFAQIDLSLLSALEEIEFTGNLLHVICDMHDLKSKPDVRNLVKMKHPDHPAMGWHCIVEGFDPAISFIIALAAKIIKSHIKKFDTIEDAARFLAVDEPELEPEMILNSLQQFV